MNFKKHIVTTITSFVLALIILSCTSNQFFEKQKNKRYGNLKNLTLIDKYRFDAVSKVQKYWLYSKNSQCKGDLKTSIVFSVLKNGEINKIYFSKKSGCADLDDSAFSAIKKAAPFEPFPLDLKEVEVTIGLNFVPEGVK